MYTQNFNPKIENKFQSYMISLKKIVTDKMQ